MQMDGIEVDVAHVGDTTVVTVAGDVDVNSAPVLCRVFESQPANSSVVVDLAGVEFMDSSGLNVLVSQHRRFDQTGGSLQVATPSWSVQRLVSVTGLDHLIPRTA